MHDGRIPKEILFQFCHPYRSTFECDMLWNFIKFLPKVKIICSDDIPFSQMHIL